MSVFSEIIQRTSAPFCVECGKCSAACSMPAMYGDDFSLEQTPRGMVQYALQCASDENRKACPQYVWRCLQCGNCTLACPEQVDCMRLIAALREEARKNGDTASRACACCGREIMAAPVAAWLRDILDEARRDENALPPFLEQYAEKPGQNVPLPERPVYEELCPVCRRQRYAVNNAAGKGK